MFEWERVDFERRKIQKKRRLWLDCNHDIELMYRDGGEREKDV